MRDKFDKEFGDIEWISDAELRRQHINEANRKRNKERVAAMSPEQRKTAYGHNAQEKARQQEARKNNPNFLKGMRKGFARRLASGKVEEQRKIMIAARQAQRGNFITPFGVFKFKIDFDKHISEKFADLYYSGDIGLKFLPHLYYYENYGVGKVEYEKVTYTPYGIILKNSGRYKWTLMDNVMQRAKDAGDPDATNKYSNDWINKMMKKYPDQYYTKTEPKREWLLEK